MTGRQLHQLLEELEDTHEIVIADAPGSDVALAVWRIAQAEARSAYDAWSAERGRAGYATYRAAEDRADAALEALAAA